MSKIPIRNGAVEVKDCRRWQSADCLTPKDNFRSKIPGVLQGRNPFKNIGKVSLTRKLSLNLPRSYSSQVNLVSHSQVGENEKVKTKIKKNSHEEKHVTETGTIKPSGEIGHSFRRSSSEVTKLKSVIEQQEVEILSLQRRLDNDADIPPMFKYQDPVNSYGRSQYYVEPDSHRSPTMETRAFSSLSVVEDNSSDLKLRKENVSLKRELQEMRDQMELMEFRLLELTENQKEHKQSSPGVDSNEKISSQEVDIPTLLHEESVKKLVKESRNLLRNCTDQEWQPVHHLLNCLSKDGKYIGPLDMASTQIGEEHRVRLKINEIVGGFQQTLDTEDFKSNIENLEEIHEFIKILQKEKENLLKENKELNETICSLSESHEIRTEASGTESELHNGKAPSIGSDLSDVESDGPPLRSSKIGSILQESGIFEPPCDMATQTDEPLLNTKMETYEDVMSAIKMISKQDHAKEVNDILSKVMESKCSCETKAAKQIQELQESDEYLLHSPKNQVVLSKSEYDSIIDEERNLRAKLEEFQNENYILVTKVSTLEKNLKSVKSSDNENEEIKKTVSILQEKLSSTEGKLHELFEEKCEFEEAENDARLMVQKLQSQLEAAQEMESLLSTSLSQEQEFSKEMQTCLQDVQSSEKKFAMENEILRNEKYELEIRECELECAISALHANCVITLFSLLVSEYARRMNSQFNTFTPRHIPSRAIGDGNESVNSCHPLLAIMVKYASSQNVPRFAPLLRQLNIDSLEESGNQRINSSLKYEESLSSLNCNLRNCFKEDSSEDNLSEREAYYLKQIKILQLEKKNLRNDYESLTTDSFQQISAYKNELDKLGKILESSENEKYNLLFRIEEIQYELKNLRDEHDSQMRKARAEYESVIEEIRKENDCHLQNYQDRHEDSKRTLKLQEQKVDSLNRTLTTVKLELAPYIDDTVVPRSNEDSISSLTPESIASHIQKLVKSVSSLKDKNIELQEKERAYMETICEADKIMSAHVTSYTKRIDNLESKLKSYSEAAKKVRESLLQEAIMKCSCLNRNEWKEVIYKDQEKEFTKDILFQMHSNKEIYDDDEKSLDNEYHEKEDLLQKLMKLTTLNSSLSSQLQDAHELSRKMNEIQQSEIFLKGRVEELENSESILKESVKKYEMLLSQKEKRYNEIVSSLEEEQSSTKRQLEKAKVDISQGKNAEGSLKRSIAELKIENQTLSTQLQEYSDESFNNDSQHRLEVAKIRSQLNLANGQLIELGNINGDLKEKLSGISEEYKELNDRLAEIVKKRESDILSFNLKLSQKDAKIEEMEAHIQHISHKKAANELDCLSSSPFLELYKSLSKASEDIKNCSKCSYMSNSIQNFLKSTETFAKILNGKSSTSNSESEESFSFDEDNINAASSPITSDNSDAVDNENPRVPPRPRRDAKLRKKRKPNVEHSILDEIKKVGDESEAKIEELKTCIQSLEKSVKDKEEELEMADSETSQLYDRVIRSDEKITQKETEVNNLKNSLNSIKEEFLSSLQKNEKNSQDMQASHKDEVENMNKTHDLLKAQTDEWKQKAKVTDSLLLSLVPLVRNYSWEHKLDENIYNIRDFCENNANESAVYEKISGLDEKLQEISSPRHLAQKRLSARLKDGMKKSSNEFISKIPILQNEYLIPARKKEVKKEETKKINTRLPEIHRSSSTRNTISFSNKIKQIDPSIRKSQSQIIKPTSYRPLNSKEQNPLQINKTTHKNRNIKDLCQSQIVKPTDSTCIKEPNLNEPLPNHNYSIRKIKSSHNYRKLKETVDNYEIPNIYFSKNITPPKNNKLKDVPKPTNLKITRRVGVDGVVIAWSSVADDCVAGYQVVVDGRVVQQVRSPKRTKALVNGLPFANGFSISLVTVARDGRCSIPVNVSHSKQKYRNTKPCKLLPK